MNILLTNDDGVKSPGLHALKLALSRDHDVWVLAPDGERSGTSHRITLKGAIQRMKVQDRTYSCSGSPADCVILGLLGGLPVKPDLVVSGINLGPNIGTDVVYSGTAAAARQAALMGLPSIAVSLDTFSAPFRFESLAAFVARNLPAFLELWSDDHFVNINAPNLEKFEGVSITRPARRLYNDRIVEFNAPDGHSYFFIQGMEVETVPDEASDWNALMRGEISVSPVYLHPVNRPDEETYRKARFDLA